MITVLLAVLATTEVPILKGTLCLSDTKPCIATETSSIEIEPAETARTWTWTSADTTRIVFGQLDTKARLVDLEPKKSRRVTLSLSGSSGRGWPRDVTVSVMQLKETRWELNIPSSSVRKLRDLTVPEGNYIVSFASARHLAERRPLRPTGDMQLGTVELKPVPAVRGRVVTLKNEKRVAVAGAQIMRSDGKLLASTREDGVFDAELSAPVPDELLVLHPGAATRVVALKTDMSRAALAADNDLGEILMESGVRLAVHIVRSGDAVGEKVRVRLLNDTKQKYELVPIATRELAADQEEVTFGDLAKGKYFVVIEGDAPLEFLSRTIELKETETNETIEIKPYRLAGSARFGEEPLRDGDVGISTRLKRDIKLPIDAEGHFGAVLWQPGTLNGWVSSKTLGSIVPTDSPELGADPSAWNITLRRRLIEGRVLDAETRQPLAAASMRLERQTAGGTSRSRLYTSVSVGQDGRYTIAAMDDGTYDIKVAHPERVPVQKTIELREADQSQSVDFALQRGVETKIEFTWASGTPVANAQVIEGVARDGHNPMRMFGTDAGGRLTLRSERGEKRTLFVVPREGSLGVARIVAEPSEEAVRVVVSPPVGTIEITLRHLEGGSQPGVPLLRFDGEWLPQSVVGRLPRDMSAPGSIRLTQLPAGTYEIWAVKRMSDNENVFAPPAREPVRVGLSSGEQRVQVPVE